MQWKPSYTEAEAREAIRSASTWRQAVERVGLRYHAKSIKNLRKRAAEWGIEDAHLPAPQRRVERTHITYTEAEAREAIAESQSWAEALRRLGYGQTGGNPKVLKARAARWGISTDHFDPYAAARRPRPKIPLEEILVEHSAYSRKDLKERLYRSGLKEPRCEMCGQDEHWRGRRIGLILDHVNGVRDDNRFENLRIVCPNCAATLDTHCGRNKPSVPVSRSCAQCDRTFRVRYGGHEYCSRACFHAARRANGSSLVGIGKPELRVVERPPHDGLLREIEELGYRAVGRRYGVSDNAIRKWLRQYERERAIAEGRDPNVVEIPTRTWPNRRRRGRKAA